MRRFHEFLRGKGESQFPNGVECTYNGFSNKGLAFSYLHAMIKVCSYLCNYVSTYLMVDSMNVLIYFLPSALKKKNLIRRSKR